MMLESVSTISLMTRKEIFLKKLVYSPFDHLTHLLTQQCFIELTHHGRFRI